MFRQEQEDSQQKDYPFIQISDIHFFSEQADLHLLLRFLHHIKSCETFVINGDLAEMWQEPDNFPKDRLHLILNCMAEVNRLADQGTIVLYMMGNHDSALRAVYNNSASPIKDKNITPQITLHNPLSDDAVPRRYFKNIHIADSASYTTPKNEKILICHGDQFDGHYTDIQIKNPAFSVPYTICASLPRDDDLLKEFHKAIKQAATENGFDGISYGHTHIPEIHRPGGILCLNAGDWIKSYTALTHDKEGNWHLLDADKMELPALNDTLKDGERFRTLRQRASFYPKGKTPEA